MLEIETLHTFDTEYSADSVEWCSSDNFQDLFVVGTYQLEEKDENVSANNIRKGRIYLFDYDFHSNVLEKVQQIETDAILDQKWRENFLLIVTSTGNVEIYKLDEKRLLSKVQEVNINSGTLALSIDVLKGSSKAVVSDSSGKISLIDTEVPNSVVHQWKAHDFEAWTCAFNRYNSEIIFSGGDDSILNVWDTRQNSEALKIASTKREAGVTSFLNHAENSLLVGSYDEKLCVFDLRNIKRPVDEISLGGGIWRIKSSPLVENCFIIATMYNNFSIIDNTNGLKLIGEYFGHDSICYGVDWSPQSKVFASCSFYDKKLCVCNVKF